jgi:hypothetical protein
LLFQPPTRNGVRFKSTHRYHLIIFKFDGDEGDDRLLVVEAGLNVTRKEAI